MLAYSDRSTIFLEATESLTFQKIIIHGFDSLTIKNSPDFRINQLVNLYYEKFHSRYVIEVQHSIQNLSIKLPKQ